MVNCYVYAHYGYGFGHLQRSKFIAIALKNAGFNVILFSSGAELPEEFIPSEIKFIQLESEEPTFVYGKNIPTNKDICREEMIHRRVTEVISNFNKRKPDIFITEFFPFSPFRLEETLIPILEDIRSNYLQCMVVSSLRDIPLTRLEKNKMDRRKIKSYLEKYYDLILVHARKEFSSFAPGRKLGNFRTNIPVRFTGYVSNDSIKKVNSYDVVISGGGGRDGREIITKSVDTIMHLEKRGVILKTLVALGPLSDTFDIKTRKNIKIVKYDPDLFSYIQKAKLNISMCGYNTTTEIYHAGVSAILFPREGSYEQNERADIVSKARKNIKILYEKKTNIAKLAREIVNVLKNKKYPNVKIEGAKKTSEIIKKFYNRR